MGSGVDGSALGTARHKSKHGEPGDPQGSGQLGPKPQISEMISASSTEDVWATPSNLHVFHTPSCPLWSQAFLTKQDKGDSGPT